MSGSEDTLLGNDLVFQVGDPDVSPTTYADMCAVFDFGSVGEEKPLVDVTALCDDGRAYRNGLADGVEIPLQSNFIPGDALLERLYTAYNADEIMPFRIRRKSGSPDQHFDFRATIRAWNVTGPIGARSVLTYTLKITGGVTWEMAA